MADSRAALIDTVHEARLCARPWAGCIRCLTSLNAPRNFLDHPQFTEEETKLVECQGVESGAETDRKDHGRRSL